MCLCTSISFACLLDAVRSPWCFKYLTIAAISICLLREPSLNIAFQSYSWYVLLASADFLVKVQKEVEKKEQDIKDHLNSLYSKYGLSKGAKEILTGKGSQCWQCSGKKKLSKTFNIYIMQGTNVRICFVDTLWSLNQKRGKKKKENKGEAQKRKARREEENFGLISKLLSDGEIPVKEVNVAALISLKGPLVYWLKQMMERGLRNDQACTLIKEYLPSFSSCLQTVNQRTVNTE